MNDMSLAPVGRLQEQIDFAEYLIEKKMVPSTIKKSTDVVNIIKVGETLGMDPLQSLNSIDVIQGSVAIKAKMIPGILARHGVSMEIIQDYVPVYTEEKIPMRDEDKKPIIDEDGVVKYYMEPDGSYKIKKTPVKIGKAQQQEYITTIRFKRYFKDIKEVIVNDVSFHWSDAVNAGWNTKPNWKSMPRFMMRARAIAGGARIAASDLLGGLYTEYETAEFTNTKMEVVDGEINIIS